jgi:hypothetical protein
VKKIASIFLACTLLLSQYGRFFSYIQCEVTGWVSQDSTQECDCQKQNPLSYAGDAKDLPPAKNAGFSFEEYDLPLTILAIIAPADIDLAKKDGYCDHYTHTAVTGIFRPPWA